MHDLATFLFAQTRVAEEEANRVYEAMIGIVTDIKDEGKLCRVRVKFPVLPDGNEKSWWATVVMMGAGKDRGWFSLPEVDDEVLCMFEHGDLGRPVIVGQMWNGKDKAIDNNSDGKDARRVIKSKKGHKITFEDDKGTMTFEDGGGVGVFSVDSKKNMVSFETKKGDMTLQSKEDLQILAKEIKITASGKVDFCGKATGVDASAADIKIEASGVVNIKGSRVDFHPGGVPQATAAEGTVEDVPDPYA
ncbi:MAG TPA: phage baseplate assembly protein V [Kofleriaceae bacterium]|nr:phage baseplate assembly protein V [Kofleriaceae bacterium]